MCLAWIDTPTHLAWGHSWSVCSLAAWMRARRNVKLLVLSFRSQTSLSPLSWKASSLNLPQLYASMSEISPELM